MTESGAQLSDANGPSASGRAESQRRPETPRQDAFSWLVGGLMHESRNALQQISAGAELLAFDLANRPEAMHLIRGIEEGQNRLVRVLDDLRLYATPQQLSVQSLDLAAVCRQIWHGLATSGNWPAAELHEVDMPTGCPCRADPTLISAAVTRLLEFVLAIAGSPVVIEIACRDIQLGGKPAVELTLSSAGLQWTADDEHSLFEPFGMRHSRGNGLELPVARRLIELHGGRLRTSTPAAGKAQFVLELPR